MTEAIVAGTDGSATATAAVQWAAGDADRRGLPLRIAHVVDRWPYGIAAFPPPDWLDLMTRAGEQVLTEAIKAVGERWPDVRVTTALLEGEPAKALREQAGAATELVIGSRGLGGFVGALLGSAVLHVAGHVPGAVVVVGRDAGTPSGEVVVGVDGSSGSEPALGFAFEQARLRGCALRAVHAWQVPVHAFAPEVVYDIEDVRQAQQRMTMGQLAAWEEKFPEVGVVRDVTYAHPVSALVGVSPRAALLVVGSRGRGAVGSVILGSISHGVIHHARCPVAIVR
ncbi:nucleotide-binding universal stress UspA family protein [Streptosporangium album]|uniref:Nucleotide-binding universal stress UspA family protein n=1 Tax=Streptosporangium album TaxID=47479 RepID=A0A7W7S4B0_9ACTN|nr:universal stress protein [Streptosporangium album]MBB4942998.1 nucleotide-binding universal stress UspA family protein [Streptosporangium album]